MNILITGGSAGLGEAVVKRFALDPGSTVYFTFNQSSANAKKIVAEFPNTVAIPCNFTQLTEVEMLTEKINSLNLDVLVNNAYTGNPVKPHFHNILVGEFESEFKNNLLPTILVTQAAIRNFRKQKKGKIITVLTSALLNTPPLGSAVYVANKAYLAALVKLWAVENIKFNITSNAISPAFMQSNLTRQLDERLVDQLIADHPLKKLLTVNEAAAAVHFLAHSSSQLNGVDIPLNAGVNIQ